MTVKMSCRLVVRSACALALVVALTSADRVDAGTRTRSEEMARGHRAAAGEVLVRVRQGGERTGSAAALLSDPLADIEREESIGRGRWRLVRSRSRSAERLAQILRARADVEFTEPNFAVTLVGTPNDMTAPLWALDNFGQQLENGDTALAGVDLDAPEAWDITQGSRLIVIATLDTGVMTTHPDLAANLWTAPRAFTVNVGGAQISCPAGSHGFNAIARTCDPSDDHGHGTHVAGSIGAVGDNGSGVVGINWTTSIMALKFMDATGNGYVSDVINAIEFAMQVKQEFAATGEADIRVLNNSWSGGGFSVALSDTVQRAGQAGMLFVAAAGNTGTDHDLTPVFPADMAGGNVLTVASTDYRDQLGAFSDFGVTRVHVAAPGVLIRSTSWSVDAPGGAYGTRSGTSMATAYTSGVAALVLSHCAYTVGALRDALVRTVVPVAALQGRVQSGGRINAAAAVRSCDAGGVPGTEIVVHAADVAGSDRHGEWSLRADATAADGVALATPDRGWSSTDVALAHPRDYFDVRFSAKAGVPYRIWLRMKAADDSKWNDSVWIQFSDASAAGGPAGAINSEQGLVFNLAPCSSCGVTGWGWQDGAYWLTRPPVVFGTTGMQTLRVQTREDGIAIDQIVVSASSWLSTAPGEGAGDATILPRGGGNGAPPYGSSTPFGGIPWRVPGTVQAEDFDEGGEGVGYHDVDAGNNGGAYRATGVDIEYSVGRGFNVGWVAAGEWLAYTIDIAATGSYTVRFRTAAYGAGGTFHLELDGADITGSILVPETGWWQSWQIVSRDVVLPGGRHVARLVMDSPGAIAVGNFDWFAIDAVAPAAAPLRLTAVDFDEGGPGVAYFDDSPGNAGGEFRATDVDIEGCAEGGFNVGWIAAGEWLQYTVTIPSAGPYDVQFRVASPSGGGFLHLESGGSNLTGAVPIPRTGAWQTWTNVSSRATLPAGRQVLRVAFDTAGFNLRQLTLVPR